MSGQYETVKMLLESGEDVDKKDEVLVFPGLCKSNVSSVDYEQALLFGFALICASF